MKSFMSFLLGAILIFASCSKENTGVTPSSIHQENAIYNDTQEDSSSNPNPNILKMSSSSILNASSANQIPSQYFQVKTKYKNYYTHLHQPDNNSCSWTSYVLCAGDIVNGNWQSTFYPVTKSKIYAVRNYCNYSIYMTDLAEYPSHVDNIYFPNYYHLYKNNNSTGRFQTIQQMLYHLYMYQSPFIVISTLGSYGHYILIWDINWVCGGTGSTVYYTDPHDNPISGGGYYGQYHTMSLTTLLNRMIPPINPSTVRYNALFLR